MVVDRETMVLKHTDLDPLYSITAYKFGGRPTIVPLIVQDDQVLFVHPTQGSAWVLPQGGIERCDGTLMAAALREGYEELGLMEQHVLSEKQRVLGECLSPVPTERNLEYTHKHLFFILISVSSRNWITLNSENRAYAWVSSYGQLMSMKGVIQKVHTVKLRATCEAIDTVCKEGLLSWSCKQHQAFS